jgi:hypothetical protein
MTPNETASTDSYFTKLPPELIADIFVQLPDLESVQSVISTCRTFCTVFQESQLRLVRSLLHRTVHLESDDSIYNGLQTLKFIITRKIIRRDVALSMFKTVWPLFVERRYDQLLMPFARALAWSLATNGKQADAIQLLQDVWEEEAPFSWTMTEHTLKSRPLSLLPLDMLLRRLQCLQPWPIEATSSLKAVPIATITQSKVRWEIPATSVSGLQQDYLSRTGILFTSEEIHILFSSTDRPSGLETLLGITHVPCQLPKPPSYQS